MELTIPLNGTNRKRKRTFWFIQGFNGLLWMMVAVLHHPYGWYTYAVGAYGLVFFIGAILSPVLDGRYQLAVDDNGIHGQLSRRRRVDFGWKDIAMAEISGLHLRLQTKDGKAEDISLFNASYGEYQKFKSEFRAALEDHGIPSQRKLAEEQA